MAKGFGKRQSTPVRKSDRNKAKHLFQQGFSYFQSGEFTKAETSFRKLLASQGDRTDAWKMLGNVCYQQGNITDAIAAYEQIVKLQPHNADAWSNLGVLYVEQKQPDRAIAAFKQAIHLQPNSGDAHNNLGQLYLEQKQLAAAEKHLQQAIKCQPNLAIAHYNLGNLYKSRHQLDLAIDYLQQTIAIQPNYRDAYNNLGNAYLNQEKLSLAWQAYYQALKLERTLDDLDFNQENSLEQILALPTTNVSALNGLAIIYIKRKQKIAAAKILNKVVELSPAYADAYNNLGQIHKELDKLTEAEQYFQQAIEIEPNFATAHYNLGNVYKSQDELTKAIAAYQQALAIEPNHSDVHNNLGNTYLARGDVSLALQCYRQTAQTRSEHNLLFALHYSSEFSPEQIYQQHRAWGEKYEALISNKIKSHQNEPNPDRKLNIGYISTDLKAHSVSYFFEPLLANCDRLRWHAKRDRQNFSITCYANNEKSDRTTARLQGFSDRWRYIYDLNDEEVAQLISQDGIDILVDLGGHTSNNRLLIFAYKPAPIQITYLGYPNTTGLSTIDYRFTDTYADPEGTTEHLHTEKLFRLPQGFLCYQPPQDSPEVNTLPAKKKGYITFGSFNNLSKISTEIIGYWAQILHQVPNSRLLLKYKALQDIGTAERIYQLFAAVGIERHRLDLRGWIQGTNNHLSLYHEVDIALDTYPYHGTTTTCEAMWMGVPVITLAGKTHVSRVGVSLLSSVGLTEFIANSPKEYIAKAVDLANNWDKLAQVRKNLRSQLESSPLTDGKAIATSIESAYRQMWRDWCRGAEGEIDVSEKLKLAQGYYHDDRFKDAIACWRSIQKVEPNNINVWDLLGNIYCKQGEFEQAIYAYEQLITLQPRNTSVLSNLGGLYIYQGKPKEAINAFNRAIAISPDCFTYNNLGQLYQDLGDSEKAEFYLQEAIKLNPDYATAYYNLGNVYKSQNNFKNAIAAYQQTIKIQPDYHNASNNLGNTYLAKSKISLAIECYQQELKIQPNCADAYNNLGIAYYLKDDLAKAIDCYQKANQLQPDNAHIYYHQIANAHKKRGDFTQAIYFYQASLRIKPDYHLVHQDLLLFLHYSSEYSPKHIYHQHQEWNKLHCPQITAPNFPQAINPNLEKKLRIGYISGDFTCHPVTYFFQPLLANHNRDNYEIFCYTNSFKADTVTKNLKQLTDSWREIYNLDNEQAAQLIRQDEIDILVDLSGHTGDNRLLLFAHKPAPIQVTYLGYPNTTGLNTIDYRFTDAYADPQGETEHLHSEKLIRLPNSFLCYQPSANAPKFEPPPVIKNNYITFGSFNNIAKVSVEVISYWAKILKEVPNSRLLLKYGALIDSDTCERIYSLFAEAEIEPNRLDLRGWVKDANDHLATYNQVDIALDTYPYHGTTTTCEALWMGVPVITLAGKVHVSRVGVSLLSSIGLKEFIANSPEEYIAKAVDLADNPDKLAQLSANLRSQLESSPLTDGKAIATSIESAYRQMWQDWCSKRERGSRGEGEQRSRGGRGAEGEIDVREQLKLAQGYYRDGKFSEAIASYQEVLKIQPDNIGIYLQLGNVYHQLGNLAKAIEFYQQALAIEPNYAHAYRNLAVVYGLQGNYPQQRECYQQLTKIEPQNSLNCLNLGKLWQKSGYLSKAIKSYQQAIELQPNNADAHSSLGVASNLRGHLTKAIACYRTAIKLKPDNAYSYYHHLANVYKNRGDISQAIKYYQKSLELKPDYNFAHRALLLSLHYSSEYSPEEIYEQHQAWGNTVRLRKVAGLGKHGEQRWKPLKGSAVPSSRGTRPTDCFTASAQDARERPPRQRKQGSRGRRNYADLNSIEAWGKLQPNLANKTFANNPNPDRKLRIGYVSGDFKHHAVAHFVEPLLANCDRANFDIYCYANNIETDATTARLKQLADGWREIHHLDDKQVSKLIQQDSIDILVDLAGHTMGDRLLVFNYKPAPIQVTYLGYPDTTGLETIDYRFTDAYADPQGQTEHLHTETLIRLQHGFLCYQPPTDTPPTSPSPVITNNYITFGSFNNVSKVSPEIIGYWANILKKVPNSRLLLKSGTLEDNDTRDRLYKLFAEVGIESNRLDLRGWIQETTNHLALYNKIDIALDTYPYNGTTTTCEALWMSVPVITLAGKTHVSRVGVSLLSAVGLNEFIADSPEVYISKAVDLANDIPKLTELRANIRPQIDSSPLTDGKRSAQSIESAYRQIWQDWCQGKAEGRRQKAEVQTFHGTSVQKAGVKNQSSQKSAEIKARLNHAIKHQQLKEFTQAEQILQQVLQQHPDHSDAWHLLGSAYYQQAKLDEAIACYEKSRAIEPNNLIAIDNLGVTCIAKGDVEKALSYWQEVMKLQPNHNGAWQNILFCLHYISKYSPEEIYAQHQAWGKLHRHLAIKQDFATERINYTKKLRIGYVSGDFTHHPVAYFLQPIFANSDRDNFEIFCYANNVKTDAFTNKLKQLAHSWREIHSLNDKQVADLIREDKIDILIDLAGHNGGNRLLVFAYKPAPIQVTYLGYADTTGLATVDYRFTDAYADPEGETEHLHTEKLIRLPKGFLCYQPPADLPQPAPPPVITNNYITFGSFNNIAKVSPEIIHYWAEILKQVPNSRLILKYRSLNNQAVCDRIYNLFAQSGIEQHRLDLRDWIKNTSNHLAFYSQIDIALDTYPYHGTTTTCEALWMGVPVITLAGKVHVSRVGVSLLSIVGLNEFIADSTEAYISKAVDLAHNLDKLTELSKNIRPQMETSSLTDGKAIAGSIESAYRQMWQDWCRGAGVQGCRGADVGTFHGTSVQIAEKRIQPKQNPEAIKIQLNQAIKHQQLKEFTQAEQVLQQHPDHSDAWHLLGSAYYQQSKVEENVSFSEKIKLAQDYYLGGKFSEAIACLRSILAIEPDNFEAEHLLGNIYQQQGDLDRATITYEKLITLQPHNPHILGNLGVLYIQQEQPEKAIVTLNKAIELAPDYADAYNNLGQISGKLGDFSQAKSYFQQALKIRPDNATFHYDLGNACHDRGDLSQAISAYQEALKLKPNQSKVYFRLGIAYSEQGSLDKAIECLNRAIAIEPDYGGAYLNLGNAYQHQGKLTQAIEYFNKAIELQPDYLGTYSNLGNVYQDRGESTKAIDLFRQACKIEPHSKAEHNLLFALHYDGKYTPEQIYTEHRAWAKDNSLDIISSHRNHPNLTRKLRIGYVSGDFKCHSVSYFLAPLLAYSERDNFEITCYVNNKVADNTSKQLQKLSDRWQKIHHLSDENICALIQQDEIDILVDLSGHTDGNRLEVFARKPVPIQITYLGYPNTTGLETIDYRFTDAYADPEGTTEHLHTEKLIRLPQGFLCYQPSADSPQPSPPPAITNNYITFGSFNNLAKVSDEIIEYWANILQQVPNSHLLLKSRSLGDEETCDRIYNLFAQYDIDRDRLELKGRIADKNEHLAFYSQIDIALDTYPYHGTTTTCEALWMGVPVITLAGKVHVSRVGVSLLSVVGLNEFIADSPEEYISKAVDLAHNLDKLTELRANLRSQMESSPLTDGKAIAGSIESAYRQMWQDWCGKREQGIGNRKQGRENNAYELNNLGVSYIQQGKPEQAISIFKQALAIKPDCVEVHNNLGQLYQEQKQFVAAQKHLQQAIKLAPRSPQPYYHLGLLYQAQNKKEQAVKAYRTAIEQDKTYADAYNNLGNLYKKLGEFNLAFAAYEQAIKLQPTKAIYHYNLGNGYQAQRRLTEAIACYQKTIELQPDYASAYNNLAKTYKERGEVEQAILNYRQAVALQPNNGIFHPNLLFSLNYSSSYTPLEIYQEHLNWANNQTIEVITSHHNPPQPDRKLRIGYVSGDLYSHSVSYFFEPLLVNCDQLRWHAKRDRCNFTNICYSNNSQTDATTSKLKQLADYWREIHNLDDKQVTELIQQDSIDILVDLSGHSKHNRLLVFAAKPSPIQVTYLGYPNTTGLSTIDYRFTDAHTDPEGTTEHLHTEKLIRLPQSFLGYQPADNAPTVTPSPVVKNKYITFGSFNNIAKVSPQIIRIWANILKQLPNSRLLLKYKVLDDRGTCDRLYNLFEQAGVDRQRLDLQGWIENISNHLAYYHQVDIALDTYPYHGTTTTCEALWMGVPVITLAGAVHVSRVGVSLLSSVGLTEFIADSPEAYISKAVDLAHNTDKLTELRANLRSQMEKSPLTDGKAIAQSIESAYRQMWQEWCREKAEGRGTGRTSSGGNLQRQPLQKAEETFQGTSVQKSEVARNREQRGVGAIVFSEEIKLAQDYYHKGEFDAAIACLQSVLQIQPDYLEAWNLLGNIYRQQDKLLLAIEAYQQLVKLQPSNVAALNNLGVLYLQQQESDRAIATFKRVIELAPDYAEAYSNLGQLYGKLKNLEQAQTYLEQATTLKPNFATAHSNLGSVYKNQDNLSAAIASYQQAAAIEPSADIYSNLASVYKDRGNLDETINYYQKCLEIEPDHLVAQQNLLFCLHYSSDYSPEQIYARHDQWGKQYPVSQQNFSLTKPTPDRKLRIGYVSGDFKNHPVAFFLEPILINCDRDHFEVICYVNNTEIDATTTRLKQIADGWQEIHALADKEVSQLIQQDRIDILVDLSGHSGHNRLLVFAHKPAPIQMTYLGYPDTTGLASIDYRLTDNYADPVGTTEHLHTEKLIRLPNSFLCYQPPTNTPQPSPPPVITNNYITFGSFNNIAKVSPQIIHCWANILKQVPNSRLLLKYKALGDRGTCDRIYHLFAQEGIDSNRLDLRGWVEGINNHLALYSQIDIALDTYPYHGTTTTCEAMWMGVPVITLAGKAHISRVGISLLSSVGLTEFIAQSPAEYVRKAVDLANNTAKLAELREQLRPQIKSSPLTDGKAIARALESAYRHVHHDWYTKSQSFQPKVTKNKFKMQKAIFFISTGRCGTQWLATTLSKLYSDLAVVTHEPIKAQYQPNNFFRALDRFEELQNIPAVRQHLHQLENIPPDKLYIETGWTSFAAIPLFINLFKDKIKLVHIVRHPVNMACSMVTHNFYRPEIRNDEFTRLAQLDPYTPGILQTNYQDIWQQMTPYEKCLFFWNEIHLYAQEIHQNYPEIPYLQIRMEDLLDPQSKTINNLLDFLDLPFRTEIQGQFKHHVDHYQLKTNLNLEWKQVFKHQQTIGLAQDFGYDFTQIVKQDLDKRYSSASTFTPIKLDVFAERIIDNSYSFLITAFLTEGYKQEGLRLLKSLEQTQLSYCIYQVPSVHQSISLKGKAESLDYTKPNFLASVKNNIDQRNLKSTRKVAFTNILYLDCDLVFIPDNEQIKEIQSWCDRGIDFAIYNWLGDRENCTAYTSISRDLKTWMVSHGNRMGYHPEYLLCSGCTQFYSVSTNSFLIWQTWQKLLREYSANISSQHNAIFPGDDHFLDYAWNNILKKNTNFKVLWLTKEYARYPWWPWVKPSIDHPNNPSSDYRPFLPNRLPSLAFNRQETSDFIKGNCRERNITGVTYQILEEVDDKVDSLDNLSLLEVQRIVKHLHRLGKTELALKISQQALQLEPSNPEFTKLVEMLT